MCYSEKDCRFIPRLKSRVFAALHKEVTDGSSNHLEYADNPIEHPLASIDRGFRSVDCTTNLSSLQPKDVARSEEHTSELQSRGHLVCRLLLENKKNQQ